MCVVISQSQVSAVKQEFTVSVSFIGRNNTFSFLVEDLKWYYDQKKILFFLWISKLC